jgi:hypothetical protein
MKDLTQFEPKYRTLIGYLTGVETETLEDILFNVGKFTGISIVAMRGKSQKREIVEARHIYCKAAKSFKAYHTLEQIGSLIGFDHSSVLYAVKQVETVPTLKKGYEEFKNGITNGTLNKNDPRKKKPVRMIKNKKEVQRFNSIREASLLTGITRSKIGECASGLHYTAGGYVWKYAE